LTYVVLPNGEKIDPRKLAPRQKTTVTKKVKLGEYEITVEAQNNSSRKNAHYLVKILEIKPEPDFIIVVGETKTAKNYRFSAGIIYKDGREEEAKIIEEEEERIFEKENGRKVYKIKEVITRTYVEANGKKILIKEDKFSDVLETKRKWYEIRVTSAKLRDKILIAIGGDTYQVRQALKALRYRWNGRTWEKIVDPSEAEKVLEETIQVIKDLQEDLGAEIKVDVVKWGW